MKNKKRIQVILILSIILFTSGCKKEKETETEQDTTLPFVEIISPPESDGTLLRNVEIEINAMAGGNKMISKVEFHVNGNLLAQDTDNKETYAYTWNCSDRFGEKQVIKVTAFDNQGYSSSDSVEVVIWNGIEKTPMPTKRYAFETCVVNGKIYVIGGYNDALNAFKIVEEYNPATDSWATRKPSNFGHAAAASCVINDIIYIFGGDEGLNWTPVVEAYDPATDTWAQKDSIPQDLNVGIGMQTCTALNGKAYLFGGISNLQPAVSAIYDPSTNSWATVSEYMIYNAASVNVNDQICLFGGCPVQSLGNCDNPSESLQAYNENEDKWIRLKDNPESHTGHEACVVNGKIYSIGGSPKGTAIGNTHMEVYNPASDSWTILTPMPNGEINFGCEEVNGKIYIIGTKVYEYTP